MVVSLPEAIQDIVIGQLITVEGKRGLVSFGGRLWRF
jgi:phosphohistidine swiveling domain-containing protein